MNVSHSLQGMPNHSSKSRSCENCGSVQAHHSLQGGKLAGLDEDFNAHEFAGSKETLAANEEAKMRRVVKLKLALLDCDPNR